MTLETKSYKYLWHILKKKNLDSILSHKMLYSELDRFNHRIQVDGAYSITTFNFNKPWVVYPGQFPGLYMSLTCELPKPEKDEVILVFPTELLYRQKNWHFNLFDRNGTIGYDTYTYKNIDTLPYMYPVTSFYEEKVGRYFNEVVFHDSIDMRNCQFVYDGNVLKTIEEYTDNKIHHELIINDSPGAFLYYSDRWYTGMDVPYYTKRDEYETSVDFYREYVKEYIKDQELIKEIDKATTKKEIEQIIEDNDLFTQLFINRK